ncbi:DUF2147 domain-containing protein [Helicobacter cholecystus]|uniref:DUF2147 domain-containing protein n=1 Tax=Helicobacter cholecystus TaxID=45498 RepID=A0A3D8IYA0_9HELI|nr:DUF2147 domain-containing protein [Helicobacter cholecystus]RDU69594.1 DUF2147 domain-containing protein [Helicobacter cholecystus]VEJ24152.1 Uncharacterized protein conserved in bacteria [Helicobacter cholecystus]
MKKIFLALLLGCFAFGEEICGYYILEKNDTGNQTIVEIFQKDNQYYAYGFANTDGSVSYDENNPNEKLRGRPLRGVVFLWGLTKEGDEYDGGKIYNYANGKTYSASAKLEGDTLKVRATVWTFGKTLIWKKLSDEQVEQYLGKKPNLQEVINTIPEK